MLRLPDIEFIGINVDGKTRWSAGSVRSKRKLEAEVPLIREQRGRSLTIGTVKVVASIDICISATVTGDFGERDRSERSVLSCMESIVGSGRLKVVGGLRG